MVMPKIDWDVIVQEYNQWKSTKYNLKQMLEAEYEDRSVFEMEKIFGISRSTIQNKMYELNIKLRERGHRHPTKLDRFKEIIQTKNYTLESIAAELETTIGLIKNYQSMLRKKTNGQ